MSLYYIFLIHKDSNEVISITDSDEWLNKVRNTSLFKQLDKFWALTYATSVGKHVAYSWEVHKGWKSVLPSDLPTAIQSIAMLLGITDWLDS